MEVNEFDVATEIIENFRSNTCEAYSTSWNQKPWTKYCFPSTATISFMMEVKNLIQETLGNDGIVYLYPDSYLLVVSSK